MTNHILPHQQPRKEPWMSSKEIKMISVLAAVVAIIVPFLTAAASYGVVRYQLDDHQKQLQHVTDRSQSDHDAITEIRSDLKYIINTLDDFKRKGRPDGN